MTRGDGAHGRAGARRAAGAVVLRRTSAGWRYLVLRAFRNWDFPKGLVEPGESPLETARREVVEETALVVDFPWGDEFRETAPYAGGKIARYYVALGAEGEPYLPVSAELGRPEHHELRWATYDDARRLLPPRLHAILDWAHAVVEGAGATG